MPKKPTPDADAAVTPDPRDPRFLACLDLLKRTGVTETQIRYSDDEDPVLWLVYAKWGEQGSEAAGGKTPLRAALRLLEAVIDGVGACAHCGKTTALSERWELPTFLDDELCWYLYDPEVRQFRRSCEGETQGRIYGRDPKTGATVGRNDPCPCGSGEKWKRCHGAS